MIEGIIHVIQVSGGEFRVVFSSLLGTRNHWLNSKAAVEQFITQTLQIRCSPNRLMRLIENDAAMSVQISVAQFSDYFSE